MLQPPGFAELVDGPVEASLGWSRIEKILYSLSLTELRGILPSLLEQVAFGPNHGSGK